MTKLFFTRRWVSEWEDQENENSENFLMMQLSEKLSIVMVGVDVIVSAVPRTFSQQLSSPKLSRLFAAYEEQS